MPDYEQIESSQRQHNEEMRHYAEMCNLEEKRVMTTIAMLNPKLTKDGNMWYYLLGDNLQEGIAGFGKTPYAAAVAFDVSFKNEAINIPKYPQGFIAGFNVQKA